MSAYMNRMLGAGLAIALGWTAKAGATDWCPTANDYTIYCSGCTRTLTCSPMYVGVLIVGNNVTLDGNGNTLWYPNDYGVKVTGNSPTIRNLVVHLPQSDGILINNTSNTEFSAITNVTVNFANRYGLYHKDGGSISVSGSTFYGNTSAGTYFTNVSANTTTNTFSSTIQSNKYNGPGQMIITSSSNYTTDNNYWYNKNDGYFEYSVDGGMVGYNYTYGNAMFGLHLWNVGAPVLRLQGNYGWTSQYGDCGAWDNGHLYVDGNSWGSSSGCVTK